MNQCGAWLFPAAVLLGLVVRSTIMGRTNEELRRNSIARRSQLIALFGGDPIAEFPSEIVELPNGEQLAISVLAFAFECDGEAAIALITSGMSDHRMTNRGRPGAWVRHEIIQYVAESPGEHAKQLAYLAWLPHFDEFALSHYHTVDGRAHSAPTGEWRNAFFIPPIIEEHDSFRMTVDGDKVSLISYIPISDVELLYKRREGHEALLTRLDERELPWIFSAQDRKPLVLPDEVLIPVFIPTLVSVLQSMETNKGSALTHQEVVQIRDKAACVMMKLSDAQKLAESRGYADIDPDFCWQQWEAFRAEREL